MTTHARQYPIYVRSLYSTNLVPKHLCFSNLADSLLLTHATITKLSNSSYGPLCHDLSKFKARTKSLENCLGDFPVIIFVISILFSPVFVWPSQLLPFALNGLSFCYQQLRLYLFQLFERRDELLLLLQRLLRGKERSPGH